MQQITTSLQKFPFRFWFTVFIILHLIVWTLAPTLIVPTMPHDAIESIVWGWQWQLGYDKHPPLAAWLAASFTDLFGTVGWPAYMLAQLAVVIAFGAIWRLALKITTPLYALISVFALEGIVYYNCAAIKFTPDTVQTPIWALLILTFYFVIKEQKLWQWLILGILAGLAILGKYEAPLLFIAMFILLVVTPEGRRCFRSLGLYLAAIISIFVVSPHIIWAYHHHFPEIAYALNSTTGSFHHLSQDSFFKRHALFAIKMLLDQLGIMIGLLLILLPFYFAPRTQLNVTRFDIIFLSFMAFGPLVLTLLYSIISGSYLIHRWGIPYFSALWLWAIVLLRPEISLQRFKWFLTIFIIVAIALPVGRFTWLAYIGPYWAKNTRADAYYPAKQIATWTTNYWHQNYHTPLSYIGGDHYLTAYISAYSTDHPTPFMGLSLSQSTWINLNSMHQKGTMLAWQTGPSEAYELPPLAKQIFPNAKLLPEQIFYKLINGKKDPVYIGFAVVPPGQTN